MNNVVKPNDVVAENPYTFGDSAMAIRVASELIDLAHDAIASQHKLTTSLLRRQEMVTAHLERLERLMNGANRLIHEAEHEQVMAEYRWLDAFTHGLTKQNDLFVSRIEAVKSLWEKKS